MLGFLLLSVPFIGLYFSCHGVSATVFDTVIFFLGFGMGYWAAFVTIAAEQFGTNIGADLIPITFFFSWGKDLNCHEES